MDSQLTSALIGLGGVLVGSIIAAGAVLYQTRRLLTAQNQQKEEEQERQTKSVASALLWEIDDFYKLSVRDVYRALKDANTSDLRIELKPLVFTSFPVFEATADKIGLFEPGLILGIVQFYGTARAYLDTIVDYRRTIEKIQDGQTTQRGKAITLLNQIKSSSAKLVPPVQSICNALAIRAKTDYTFEAP